MAKWSKKIDIKKILKADVENTSPEYIVDCAKKIVALLDLALENHPKDDYDINEITESFREVGCGLIYTDLENFNYILNELYNWADDNRVWLGD